MEDVPDHSDHEGAALAMHSGVTTSVDGTMIGYRVGSTGPARAPSS